MRQDRLRAVMDASETKLLEIVTRRIQAARKASERAISTRVVVRLMRASNAAKAGVRKP